MHPIERLRYVARSTGAPPGAPGPGDGECADGLPATTRRHWSPPVAASCRGSCRRRAVVALLPDAGRRRPHRRVPGGRDRDRGRPHAPPWPPRCRTRHGPGARVAVADRRRAGPPGRRRGAGRRHPRRGVGVRPPPRVAGRRRRGRARVGPGRRGGRGRPGHHRGRRRSGRRRCWPRRARVPRRPSPATPACRCGPWSGSGGCCRAGCGMRW